MREKRKYGSVRGDSSEYITLTQDLKYGKRGL